STDKEWVKNCNSSGLSSGEGLIWQVRDPIEKHEPIKQKGRVIDYQDVITDKGVDDKRLLIVEPEFALVLKTASCDGNTLSAIIRQAWDDGNLRSLTKSSPARATDAHISIIGHITKDELRRYLEDTETANGFANRFLLLLCYEVTQYARQTFLVRCHFSAGSKGSVGGVARSPRLVPCAASQSKSGCVAPDVPVGLPDRRLPGTPGFLNPDWSPAPCGGKRPRSATRKA